MVYSARIAKLQFTVPGEYEILGNNHSRRGLIVVQAFGSVGRVYFGGVDPLRHSLTGTRIMQNALYHECDLKSLMQQSIWVDLPGGNEVYFIEVAETDECICEFSQQFRLGCAQSTKHAHQFAGTNKWEKLISGNGNRVGLVISNEGDSGTVWIDTDTHSNGEQSGIQVSQSNLVSLPHRLWGNLIRSEWHGFTGLGSGVITLTETYLL